MARIPYVDPENASPEVRERLDELPALNIFRMLAHADSAFVPLVKFNGTLLTRLELDERLRELAILLVAQRTGAEYEWIQHAGLSRGIGMPEEEIAAIERGDLESDCLEENARVLLRFVDEVLAGPQASDETFAALSERFPPRQIVELLLVVGIYQALARLMTSLDLDLDGPVGTEFLDEARRRYAE